ncbi:MAG: polysaccharide biosynthesis C-terminal domain-containing protein, partial [Clostridia bacterium]|nr:polysaccharide biosynthesis C-terminal domain-containing protein [Clostridia bacterium]
VQFITLGGALLNVLLNFLLIPQLGEMGAAVASLVTQAFSNFIIYLFIPKIRPCIKIMIKGIFFPFFYLRRIKD